MSKTNTQIVQEFVEEVLNQKHFNRIYDYVSQDCTSFVAPYVGLGFNFDFHSEEQIYISDICPNSPAAGKVKTNDKIMRVMDGENILETFLDLKSYAWGQGVLNSSITITVDREGEILDIPLQRGRVEWLNMPQTDLDELYKEYFKTWPDLKVKITVILEEGDLVSFHLVNSGTNQEYHQSAIWDECNICRIKDEKVIEWWGVEHLFSQMKQLGYKIVPPVT